MKRSTQAPRFVQAPRFARPRPASAQPSVAGRALAPTQTPRRRPDLEAVGRPSRTPRPVRATTPAETWHRGDAWISPRASSERRDDAQALPQSPPRPRSGARLRRTPTVPRGSLVLHMRSLRGAFPTRRPTLRVQPHRARRADRDARRAGRIDSAAMDSRAPSRP